MRERKKEGMDECGNGLNEGNNRLLFLSLHFMRRGHKAMHTREQEDMLPDFLLIMSTPSSIAPASTAMSWFVTGWMGKTK